MQVAQYISSRVQYKKRSRSGLRRGFLYCDIGEIDKSRCVSYFSTVPYYIIWEVSKINKTLYLPDLRVKRL